MKNNYSNNRRNCGYKGARASARVAETQENVIYGRNAVRELLRSGRAVDKIFVKRGEREGSITMLVAMAIEASIPVLEVDSAKLDDITGGAVHQGIVAYAAEKEYSSIEEIVAAAKEKDKLPLIVIADEIEDPYNLGAIIRTAECVGADGLIIPKRRSATLTGVVSKASAGAIAHLPIAKVSNIAAAIDELKDMGIWVFAAEAGGTPYYETDFKLPAAVILGSEGNGVGRLIKEKSDFIVSIPMYGNVNSLNVSAAAAIILSHAARMQRT